VPPVDSLHDIRSAMCMVLAEMGLDPEVHHHEVATAGQCEIGVAFGSLVKKADEVQKLKYVVWNVAQGYGKTATSCPSRWWATTATACTSTSPWRRTARTCSPARSTAACPRRRCTTSVASSSTPAR
jgi:hypothetical protein